MLALLGCQRLKSADALTYPVMMHGIYLGLDVEEWVPPGVDIGDGDEELGAFAYTALAEIFVAYVGDGSLEDAPVEELDVELRSQVNRPSLRLKEQEEGGFYRVTSKEGLDYDPRDEVEVSTDFQDDYTALFGMTPNSAEYDVPSRLSKNEDLEINLRGGEYDNLIIGVYYIDDLEGGEMTYDNLPSGFSDIYDFTHPTSPVRSATIDGREAFHESGLYILGVAGMQIAPTEEFSGVNTTVSAFMTGQISLRLLTVE